MKNIEQLLVDRFGFTKEDGYLSLKRGDYEMTVEQGIDDQILIGFYCNQELVSAKLIVQPEKLVREVASARS